jgi:hypothetical protein
MRPRRILLALAGTLTLVVALAMPAWATTYANGPTERVDSSGHIGGVKATLETGIINGYYSVRGDIDAYCKASSGFQDCASISSPQIVLYDNTLHQTVTLTTLSGCSNCRLVSSTAWYFAAHHSYSVDSSATVTTCCGGSWSITDDSGVWAI